MGFCALFLYKSDLFFYQKDIFTLCVVLFSLASCSDDSGSSGGETVNTKRQIKVAVVLPASGEQNTRFHRIADWYLSTLKGALEDSKFSTPFTLSLEWCDRLA